MKVIKKGHLEGLNWWVGSVVACRHCTCAYELEAGDTVTALDGICSSVCPTCKNPNSIHAVKQTVAR